MRFLKHGVLSILRKPTKAIMIFVIMFVVFSMVFTGIIINNSVTQSKEFIRTGLGAVVEYKVDYMKAMQESQNGLDLEEVNEEDYQLSISTAEDISKDSRVDKTFISQSTEVMSDEYKSAEPKQSGDGDVQVMDMGGMGGYYNIKSTSGGYDMDFEKGTSSIVKGQNINEVDSAVVENPVVVSSGFANANELELNETLTFTTFYSEDPINFTVVGFYESTADQMFESFYTAESTFENLPESPYGDVYQKMIYFKLKDPLAVDGFIADNSSKLPSRFTVLDAGSSEYDKLTRPLNLMSTIAKIFIGVVFVAGTIIVIALVAIFVRDRKFEIGLLLSSGEGKIKIVSQFIFEIAVVALLAFILSMLLSTQTSKYVGEWIVDNQLVEQKAEMTDFYFYGESEVGKVSMDNVAEDFDAKIDGSVIMLLFFISSAIVLVASSIPLGIIMSYNPRQALQD